MNGLDRIIIAPSLLTREESNAIKGVLIILVVFGHNSVLMQTTGLFPYLYSFHVYCFLVLPYLYGLSVKAANVTWFHTLRKLLPRWGRYYTIYLMMTLLCTWLAYVCHRVEVNPLLLLRAFLTGSQGLLIQHAGFGMLWYLPVLCAVLFWHSVYFHLPPKGRIVLVAICCSLWMLAALGITNYHELGVYVPFALMPGLYHCLTGCASRYLARHIPTNRITRLATTFSLLFIPLFVFFRSSLPWAGYYLTWLLCPIVAFNAFYQFRNTISKSLILQKIGALSFSIYLTHVFIYNLLLLMYPNSKWQLGIVLFFGTLFISYILSFSLVKISFIRQFI